MGDLPDMAIPPFPPPLPYKKHGRRPLEVTQTFESANQSMSVCVKAEKRRLQS